MSLPKELREDIKARLWAHAEKIDWGSLSSLEKAKFYTQWTDSVAIGGILGRYMDPRVVRVYIKDTLLKGFGREELVKHQSLVLRIVSRENDRPVQAYIKPHGLRFSDGFLVAWGRADDWKILLGALFERAYPTPGQRTAVLFRSSPRFTTPSTRKMVEQAAECLGTQRCIWFD